MSYVIGIDQSTQGTKALLFDDQGQIVQRCYLAHEQIVNQDGWVSHNPLEIYNNLLSVVKQLVKLTNITGEEVVAVGITNQRETSVVWDCLTKQPVTEAIVWQCSRAKDIVDNLNSNQKKLIKEKTGLNPSPFYPAAKYSWILKKFGYLELNFCCGTIDSWLLYKLTNGSSFKTDYSNASRTQLFNLETLSWDKEICEIFQIPISSLPDIIDSDGEFGETDFEGLFSCKVPIRSMMGDSHAALYAQRGFESGATKVTYGTGSSVMMNVGSELPKNSAQLSTSIGWKTKQQLVYVLEGNINYTGAVVTWLKEDLELINSPDETTELLNSANPEDKAYLVPAFSGLSAPFWRNDVTGLLTGMTRTTGKAEIVKASIESIAYQINSVVDLMREESKINLTTLSVDGGATKNDYLMQFQSDISAVNIKISDFEEASCIGVSYLAGIKSKIYTDAVFSKMQYRRKVPIMKDSERRKKCKGWDNALSLVLRANKKN